MHFFLSRRHRSHLGRVHDEAMSEKFGSVNAFEENHRLGMKSVSRIFRRHGSRANGKVSSFERE